MLSLKLFCFPFADNHNKGGTVFGAIVGAVLGCALISLVGYFICGKRKPKSFAHQRLYDDTRNDPGKEISEQNIDKFNIDKHYI